jgi:alkanesulfonate monooxygenase SsuD/methylene tetrahydromethanopterin reductase-like flavin-dependent oxidoreductase (luciferase family)
VEEAVFAEEMGFHGWGTSEHHSYTEMAVAPSPEVLFTAVAMRTNRIKLRYMSRLVSAIHPVLVAEQTASTDIFSNGRVELTVARGNTLLQLDAFGVPLDETKGRAEEALDLIVRALSDPTFDHDGKYWGKIPERELTPRGVQEPHPRLYKIGQTVDSIQDARRRGLGMITCDMWLGWDKLAEYLAAYGDPEHIIHQVQRVKELGADEIVLRIDNAKHDVIMETLENIGRYVIPYFNNPAGVLRSGPVGLLPGERQPTGVAGGHLGRPLDAAGPGRVRASRFPSQ